VTCTHERTATIVHNDIVTPKPGRLSVGWCLSCGAVRRTLDGGPFAGDDGWRTPSQAAGDFGEEPSSPERVCITGKFRVYFNRHGAEPLMWCVSPETGGWEIAVRDVQLATIAESVYRKKETADEDDGRPSAWFAVEGVLTVNAAGFATIGSP
jgi:hypothetical protein